jgi:IPT/TIG domain
VAWKSSKRQRVVAGLAVTAAACAGAVIGNGVARASTSTTVAITAVSPHFVAAGTANQTITITGKGFSGDTISGITITGAGACTTDPGFIVLNATNIALKTTGTDCAAGAATITITDTSGTATNPSGAAAALTFVPPPSLATVDTSHNAMVTDDTADLAFADQALSAPIAGGTVVRVLAGATPFSTSTSTPLTATFGGVAISAIAVGPAGAYFTGKLGVHAAGTAALSVTSGGVTKAFTTAQTNNFSYAGSKVTITPTNGPANGGTTLTVTGTGFTSASTATVGGAACTTPTVTGTTKLTCTVPKLAAGKSDGPATVIVTTAGVGSVLTTGSVYTYLAH